MKKNVMYLVYDYENYKNKILGQAEGFENKGYDVYILTIKNTGEVILIKIINGKEHLIESKFINNYRKYTVVPRYELKKYINKLNKKYKFEIFYVRRLGIDITGWRSIFKEIKKNKDCKIYYEIPTYPIDKISDIKGIIAQNIEKVYFKTFLYKYIDCIPVIIQNECSLDKKMIEFNNAISKSFININYTYPNSSEEEFKIVAIAHVNNWHGYDRAIQSIAEYNGKNNISLCIISNETKELKRLEGLVAKFDIQDKITFKKYSEINDLKIEANNYHIALGGLAYWKRNGKYDTSIKNKEYCALGIPFVIANEDRSFDSKFKYKYRISPDNSNFDIDRIIDWYREFEKTDYKKEMISYSTKNLLFINQINKIIK